MGVVNQFSAKDELTCFRPWKWKNDLKSQNWGIYRGVWAKLNVFIVFYVQFWVRNDLAGRLGVTKFGIFDFVSDFLVIFGYSLALNMLNTDWTKPSPLSQNRGLKNNQQIWSGVAFIRRKICGVRKFEKSSSFFGILTEISGNFLGF